MAPSWPVIRSETVFDLGLFRVRRDRARSPRNGAEGDFYVIDMADWLQVIPQTADGRLVMVRQYRFGSRAAGLEFPGGLLDPGDDGPAAGAERELLEETGYGGGGMTPLGSLWAQPALMSVRVHLFLMREAREMTRARPDVLEDLEIVLVAPAELGRLIAAGEVDNAITVAAFGSALAAGHVANSQ